MINRHGYQLKEVVLGSTERDQAVYNLSAARIILERAAKKYAFMSQGGLARALEMVEKTLELVQPNVVELIDELENLSQVTIAEPRARHRALSIVAQLRRAATAGDRDRLQHLVSLFSDPASAVPATASQG